MVTMVSRLFLLGFLLLALPLAHAPMVGQVIFTLPQAVVGGSPFNYTVTLSGFYGNFSGGFWLGGYELCGWAGNLRDTRESVTVTCQPIAPMILDGQTVLTMFNANTTYYQGPSVMVLGQLVGLGGHPPLPV